MNPEQSEDQRPALANERTFLAWIRTALALVVTGCAVIQLLPNLALPGGGKAIGIPLLVLAGALAGASFWRWDQSDRAIRDGDPLPRTWLILVLPAFVAVAGVLIAVAAVMTPPPPP